MNGCPHDKMPLKRRIGPSSGWRGLKISTDCIGEANQSLAFVAVKDVLDDQESAQIE